MIEIIWSRTFGKGKQYGVNFNHQEAATKILKKKHEQLVLNPI